MDDDVFDCSYEEDNPSETSVALFNESSLAFLDDSVDSHDESNLHDGSLMNISFDDSDLATSTPSSRTRSKTAAASTPCTSTSSSLSQTPKKRGLKGKEKPNRKAKEDGISGNLFKVPKAPAFFAKCAKCGQPCKTPQSFQSHTQSHIWKDLASKIPVEAEVRTLCKERAGLVLEEICKKAQVGEWGTSFNEACCELLKKCETPQWGIFLNKVSDLIVGGILKKKCITFPATCRHFMSCHLNACLNNSVIRDELLEKILSVQVCIVQVAYPFLTKFILNLGNAVLARMFFQMSERDPLSKTLGAKRSKDDFDQLKSEHVVHYIAGSCMRQIIRHAYSHPKNAKLHRRKLCILKRFGCIGEPTGAQLSDKAYWTSILNRKSLFFVKDEVLPFFVNFAKIVQTMELPDGSLNHEKVMEGIAASPYLMQVWCEIVGGELDDDESIDLLNKVVTALTNTYSRGIVNRRMNVRSKKGIKNKATASVSHRARLL